MNNIDTILQLLNYLDFDYKINHTNDYSELVIPRNNDLVPITLIFDCGTRVIFDKMDEEIEE